MIYGHARIPITAWLRENTTESLTHAQEAGEMIMRLHQLYRHLLDLVKDNRSFLRNMRPA
jgi:hypothetical protein